MMSATKHPHKLSSAALAHLNELLDEALSETFPASDPTAIAVELGSEEETGFHDAVGRAPVRRHPPGGETSQ